MYDCLKKKNLIIYTFDKILLAATLFTSIKLVYGDYFLRPDCYNNNKSKTS